VTPLVQIAFFTSSIDGLLGIFIILTEQCSWEDRIDAISDVSSLEINTALSTLTDLAQTRMLAGFLPTIPRRVLILSSRRIEG
jgi:hypothetical protein